MIGRRIPSPWKMWAMIGVAIAGALMAPLLAVAAPDAGALPDPSDPLERLYGHKRLAFEADLPVLTVRIMEGKRALTAISRGAARIAARAADGSRWHTLDVPAGSAWTFRLRRSVPAEQRYFVQAGEFHLDDRAGLLAARKRWSDEGFEVSTARIGSRYGISGRVIDTRRDLLLVGPAQEFDLAQALQRSLQAEHGVSTRLHPILKRRPQGEIEISDGMGRVRFVADTMVALVPLSEAPTLVRQVEFGVGYAFHDHQDRAFRGELIVAIDAAGELALVNRLDMETYLRGIVPSEIFASAHPEALKAQAVTARGEVLAKIGARHLTDPYLLCAEQHCQVYSGVKGEAVTTDRAIADTRGQVLFSDGGRLVNSTYSAVCGGHTEDSEIVWGGLPDPDLRGRSDVPISARTSGALSRPLSDPEALHAFLVSPPKAYCASASLASPTKYRWEKRFTREAMDALCADLGIGRILALTLSGRGASGRASVLTLSGEKGARQIHGELAIRRRFENLNSTLAEIEPPSDRQPNWIFRGAGWGHGVGMCQVGAIGRAEAGQSYRDILRHYFSGAKPEQIYGAPRGERREHRASP